MEYDIIEVEDLSGTKAHIYTIRLQGETRTLLDDFFEENKDQYTKELTKIVNQLKIMGHKVGCQDTLFKVDEGRLGDGVCAISVGRIRLYCIRYGNITLILGSGGFKPPDIRAYQENSSLNTKAQQVKDIAAELNQMIKDREIRISEDGVITIDTNDYD